MGVSTSDRLVPLERAGGAGHVLEPSAARVLYRYLQAVGRRAHLTCVKQDGSALAPEDVRRTFFVRPDGRSILPTYWGADAVAVAALPFLDPIFLAAAREVAFLFDDTFGGHVCGALVAQLGGRFVVLPRPGDARRLEKLRDVMRRGGSYAFAVDGGGPYFKVGHGTASLARSFGAFIIPLACVARPALPWVHRSRISFPLPWSRVAVAIGDPIDALSMDRHAIVRRLQGDLEALARTARGVRTVARHRPSDR